jgi:Domain of unknown function (DUF4397)
VNRSSKWIPLGLGAAILCVLLASIGCGTSSSSSSSGTQMRVVHLAPNPGPVDLFIDNKSVSTNITYGTSSPFLSVAAGNHDVKFNQAGGTINLFDNPAESFVGGTSYTYLFIESPGPVYSGNKLIDDHTTPDAGKFKIRVINGSPTVGSVDVYILTPGTALPGGSPAINPTIPGLGSNAPSTYQSILSGSYNIYVAPSGDLTCFTNPAQPIPLIPKPWPPSCLINLDGRNSTGVPTFTDGQIRTLIMKNQVPITSTGPYDTITLTDLN